MKRLYPVDASGDTAAPSFGELLRRKRRARGWTQAELAEHAGLSTRGINDLERGARSAPRRDTVMLLAQALNLTPEERAQFVASARRPRAPRALRTSPSRAAAPHAPRKIAPPSGTITFLFTDIEGSTALLRRLGDAYPSTLERHCELLREAITAHHGYEVDTQGDSFFVAFPTANDALGAVAQAQRSLLAERWPAQASLRVRMGLHTGAPGLVGDHYVGMDVHRAARIAAAAHGGQVILSAATAELARGALAGLPDGTQLRHLGAHRLKDLGAPEQLWQLVVEGLPDTFPPLRVMDRHTHNLPVQPTALLGRKREVAELTGLLRGDAWLVTVTGSPGVGKTRLTLQVAAELVGADALFPDGVWFVRLSRIADPSLLMSVIAQALGLRESRAKLLEEMLRDYLSEKRLLLLLDNFEQITEAAGELAGLLHSCPGVRALVTSRAPLHLRGEREYALSPLPTPALAKMDAGLANQSESWEALATYPSVALFAERAQAAQSSFSLTSANASAVATICARLDGLPLALELAAARIKVMPPETMLPRLTRALPLLSSGPRDADERQRTMRATLAWSEQQLSADHQALFRRLAVFVGGATLSMVEEVCLAPIDAAPLGLDVVDGLSALVDQSLVQWREEPGAEPRFVLLHVVQEYARERLEASGEGDALRRAHLQACVRLAREPGEMGGIGSADWLARMRAEQDNLRTALGWAVERGETELSLQLVVGAAQLWWMRGNAREASQWLDKTVRTAEEQKQIARDMEKSVQRALYWALIWANTFSAAVGRLDTAEGASRRELELAQTIGNEALKAQALYDLCWSKPDDTEAGRAKERIAQQAMEALTIGRRAGNEAMLATILCQIGGLLARAPSRMEMAIAYTEEGLLLSQRLGDHASKCAANLSLAELHGIAGKRDAVIEPLLRAFEIALADDIGFIMPRCLQVFSALAAERGRAIRAARLFGAADARGEQAGIAMYSISPTHDHFMARAWSSLGEARWAAEFATGRAMSDADVIAEARKEARDEPA